MFKCADIELKKEPILAWLQGHCPVKLKELEPSYFAVERGAVGSCLGQYWEVSSSYTFMLFSSAFQNNKDNNYDHIYNSGCIFIEC